DDDPEDRWEGLEIDQAFYSVDLGRLLRDTLKPSRELEVDLTVGRQFIHLGTGLAFNSVVDGFSLTTLYGDFCVKLFGAKSNHDEDDVDTSRPGCEHMNRTFWGGQVDYVGMRSHTPYFFFMRQSDHNTERTEVLQDFKYDSYYLGLGIRGELAERLGYYAEHIREGGKSTAQTDFDFLNQRQEIIAEACNVGLDYMPICRFQPHFALQYVHGSGDDDRISVAEADRGNLGNTNDYGFLAFGYVFAGYSLEPDVSNINIIRFGASAKFLEEHEAFSDLELGFDYFNYWKDEREGGISDYRAVVRMDQPERNDIGDELDLRLDWRIFSDLSFTARFGMFWTGDAYEDDVRRDFLVLGLTLSF
ncbi:MAG: alginate export family protein, partial [Planctomycetota bacterium]|nr:alginate export family protein [Planctomycetota bacterium]